MPSTTLYIAGITAVVLIIQKLVTTFKAYSRARSLGCRPANKYPHTHPLGFDIHRARVEAVKAGRRNGFDLELFVKYGSTYEEKALLGKIINTCVSSEVELIE